MAEKKRLNVDIPRAISDFEAVAKEFELKEKIYKVILRGKGLEFETFRDFTPDDDASFIDWKASKRANKLLVKQYIEERDLDIVFVVDVGENMILGSGGKLKCEYATELIAALAHLIITSNDRVGLLLYSDKVKKFIVPKGGLHHFWFCVDVLSDPTLYGGASRVDTALDFVLNSLRKTVALVIFVSDFVKLDEEVTEDLFLSSHKFENLAIMVKDPLDKNLPDIDREIVIEDPRTGEQLLINPHRIKDMYERNVNEREGEVKDILERGNIDMLELTTEKDFAFPLAQFLRERVKKKGFFSAKW